MDTLRPRMQSLAGSLVSHRLLLYTLSSTIAVSAVIANALRIHSNFYSITVYLSKSGHSVLVRYFSTVDVWLPSYFSTSGTRQFLFTRFLSMWTNIAADILWIIEAARS